MEARASGPALAPLRWRTIFAAGVALSLLGLAPSASANHVQNDNGSRAIAFDHVTGNEWWVEVAISGPDAFTAIGVFAHDGAGSNLYGLEKKSWGTWGGSFHIEPGHPVQFRALWTNGAEQESCWFTHPAGVEKCGTPPPPPPPPAAFDAAFTGFTGNEWWEQATVKSTSAAYSIGTVDIRINNGGWRPLAQQSWGGWAASYQAGQGSIVQMRATATNGDMDLSSCRQWIPASGQDATVVTCPTSPPPPPPPPPTGFDATFTGVKGNDWWVQVNVAGNQPVSAVVVRVSCAMDWQPLTKQSWGGWTASFNIPAGSKVDFQARNATYASDVSGGYLWPEATPAAGCAQGDWPRQGSNATYNLASGVCGGGNCENSQATLRLVYEAGRWLGSCAGRDTFYAANGTQTNQTWTTDNGGLPPIRLPTNTQVGATHRPDMFQTSYTYDQCSRAWISSPVTVVRQENTTTSLRDASGNPVTLRAWYAESTNPSDNLYTTHWDTKLGLILDLRSNPRMSSQGSASMLLVETNAPVR